MAEIKKDSVKTGKLTNSTSSVLGGTQGRSFKKKNGKNLRNLNLWGSMKIGTTPRGERLEKGGWTKGGETE